MLRLKQQRKHVGKQKQNVRLNLRQRLRLKQQRRHAGRQKQNVRLNLRLRLRLKQQRRHAGKQRQNVRLRLKPKPRQTSTVVFQEPLERTETIVATLREVATRGLLPATVTLVMSMEWEEQVMHLQMLAHVRLRYWQNQTIPTVQAKERSSCP